VLRLAKSPLSRLPLQTLYSFPSSTVDTIREACKNHHYDLVHIQLARMGPAVDAVPHLPTVLDFIDALSLNMRRRAARETRLRGALFQFEAQRMAEYERALVHRTTRQVISSETDRLAVGGSSRTMVIPNGVDLDDYPYRDGARDGTDIIFTGRMAYFPNADAAVHFAKDILPIIRGKVPTARFRVVGAEPPKPVRDLTRDPSVEVTGFVPSVAAELGRAAVAVASMRSGSGMQFKVIEAMATGTPVVASSYALGGLEARHEQHLLVADDASAFADAVIRLLLSPELGARLARNARRLVEERYTWDAAVAKLERVYEDAVREGPVGHGLAG
jgi:glycosyltransferase involved in cell wall biosynthesis